ncbi:MAG: ATP-binding protein, partial [Candidatus Eremiobacterota bacterium]
DPVLQAGSLPDWRTLLGYLEHHPPALDLVLDEFPYLCQAEPALPSLLQAAWDRSLQDGSLRLFLCGSSVSFMEQEVLAAPSPLFGRRTGQMRLGPMDFWSAQEFVPHFSPAERVEAYACLGGTPAYLAQAASGTSLAEGLLTRVLDPVAYLFEEPRLLLHQELRELKHYFALLTAIAAGKTRLNEIAQDVGLERTFVTRYLDVLSRLELIDREVPVTEANPQRSRKGLFRICDPFFRFWFRFVAPNLTELTLGEADWILRDRILPGLDHFVAQTFEEVCRQWIRRRAELPFRPQRVGRWWDSRAEIDVVAYDDRWLLVGECKWSRRRVGGDSLRQLRERRQALPGYERHRTLYALFSRSGFEAVERAPDVLLVDLSTLLG